MTFAFWCKNEEELNECRSVVCKEVENHRITSQIEIPYDDIPAAPAPLGDIAYAERCCDHHQEDDRSGHDVEDPDPDIIDRHHKEIGHTVAE